MTEKTNLPVDPPTWPNEIWGLFMADAYVERLRDTMLRYINKPNGGYTATEGSMLDDLQVLQDCLKQSIKHTRWAMHNMDTETAKSWAALHEVVYGPWEEDYAPEGPGPSGEVG